MQTRCICAAIALTSLSATSFIAVPVVAQTCVDNPGDGPDICADWDETPDPVHNDDFFVTFSDEDYPDVVLDAGSQTWRVYSKDPSNPNNPGDIGDITVQQSQGGRIYSVRLRRADGTAGARNVKSFDLSQCCNQWRTDIYDSLITGAIEGNVLADWGFVDGGGELELETAGNVGGNVTARKIVADGLIIGGQLGGDLDVDDVVAEGATVDLGSLADNIDIDIDEVEDDTSFRIAGGVPGEVLIWVRQFGANVDVDLGYSQTGDYDVDGTVNLVHPPGLPATTEVTVYGNVGGTLYLSDNLIGTATVLGNVESGGRVSATGLAGTLTIAQDVAGDVQVGGDIGETGVLTIAGDVLSTGDVDVGAIVYGSLSVDGDLVGDVTIGELFGFGGQVEGSIEVGNAVSGTIHVTSGSTLDGDVIAGASIAVRRLAADGRILIDGLGSGQVAVARGTNATSLIRMIKGLGSGGTVEINTIEGENNANGDMWFGSTDPVACTSCCPVYCTYDTVEFDGCIRIYDEGGQQPTYGNLNGEIIIVGCHDDANDIIIQIDGDRNGTILVDDYTCQNQPSVDFNSTCPIP